MLDIFYYLSATLLFVPFSRKIGLGSVAGYLISGIILGPAVTGLLQKSEDIQNLSQFGIMLLLFVIGLELTPARLKKLNKYIIFDGASQFIITTAIIAIICIQFKLSLIASLVIGSAISLSSTAFALYYLQDTEQLTKSYGQSAFGTLLFQDLIIIPILTILPFLSQGNDLLTSISSLQLVRSLAIVSFAMLVGKYTLCPALNWIHNNQNKELFIATCLLTVISSALLMEYAGLSKALGAFMAGIFLSGSHLKIDIQHFTVPLKSMLMGVFFVTFGLGLNIEFLNNHLIAVIATTLAFMSIKFLILQIIGKVGHGSWATGYKMGAILCQGGEFSVLVLSVATTHALVPEFHLSLLMSSITISIFLAPFITSLLSSSADQKNEKVEDHKAEVISLKKRREDNPVIPSKKAS